MKKYLFLLLIIISCKQINHDSTLDDKKILNFSMKEFKNLVKTPKNLVMTMNNLDKKAKLKFLKEFIPNLKLYSPPYEQVKFQKNNKIIIENKNNISIGTWTFTGDTLVIKIKTGKFIIFKEIHINNFYAELGSNNKEIWIDFHIQKSIPTHSEVDKIVTSYIGHGDDYASDVMDGYCKSNHDICN